MLLNFYVAMFRNVTRTFESDIDKSSCLLLYAIIGLTMYDPMCIQNPCNIKFQSVQVCPSQRHSHYFEY